MKIYDRIELFCIVLLLCVIAFAVLGGCAPMTEQQLYEAENRKLLIREEYARDTASCNAAGGVMQARKWRATRIPHEPSTFEMITSECVDPQAIIDEMRRQGF